MKKIGLGIQEFSKFKKNNLVYVDKTEIIYHLTQNRNYSFLSRPRRFGKSLLLNTLKELFFGNQPLFQDCWIHNHWNWQETSSVIHIDFTQIQYERFGLEQALDEFVIQLATRHGVQLTANNYAGGFLELIQKLGAEKPVVILIDEYDKPIIDYLEGAKRTQAIENRDILKSFYAGIKSLDHYIRFLFITGVSKFTKVSIFSDLNHLADISIVDDYAQIVGYTEAEILKYYSPYLDLLAEKLKMSRSALVEQMRVWYNGYSWDGQNFLYNPFSVLSFLSLKAFDNFWFETGSPTFLIEEFKKSGNRLNEAVNQKVFRSTFNKYDIDNINPTGLMFQTGYLTIKDYDLQTNQFTLDFPNKEVRESFVNFAVEYYANSSPGDMALTVEALVESLQDQDFEQFTTIFKSLFSSITVKQLDKVKEYEGFYHSIIYIVLKLIGVHIQCEIQSSFGATDAVIQTPETTYVMEFKMGSAQAALAQIKKKRYYAPYQADGRKIILVGLSFDKAQRNLVDFVQEDWGVQ